MRSFVVGTAGHIDHGKSALVLALTGTDPDRLKEEKERGITIDLGFAHAALGDDVVASFVDVPGHERFVRNMLAGAHGVDAVLLVVAADESVMPQTREHFHICRLLGIERGLVALTKCDLADAETRALAEMEVHELVAGSFLEGAEVVRVSARTGEGIAEIRQALARLATAAPSRASAGLLRVPVDRAFTLKGFGTVVTGTVVSGEVRVGDELELLPAGRRTRARGLHVHGEGVPHVPAGSRVAVNVSGLEVGDVERGDVLARPGELRRTWMLDVILTLLAGGRPLDDGARVRLHVASAEVLARVRLLDRARVEPGGSGLAQLRLERPAVAGRGDRLILRGFSPVSTLGGARVLDPLPPKRRSRVAVPQESPATLADEAPVDAAVRFVTEAGAAGIDGGTLAARVTAPRASLEASLEPEHGLVAFGADPVFFVSRRALDGLAGGTRAALAAFHRENPLRPAMPREELRRRVFKGAPTATLDRVLDELRTAGEVRLTPDAVRLARHEIRLGPAEERARQTLLDAAVQKGLAGLEVARLAEESGLDAGLLDRVSRVLLAEDLLRRVGDAFLVHRDHLEALKQAVPKRFPAGSRLDVGAFKDMTGLTRKHVIPLLEYLDRERITRRSGSERWVLAP